MKVFELVFPVLHFIIFNRSVIVIRIIGIIRSRTFISASSYVHCRNTATITLTGHTIACLNPRQFFFATSDRPLWSRRSSHASSRAVRHRHTPVAQGEAWLPNGWSTKFRAVPLRTSASLVGMVTQAVWLFRVLVSVILPWSFILNIINDQGSE